MRRGRRVAARRAGRNVGQGVRRRNAGQGIVELVLTLLAFFTVMFLIVQVSLGFGVANYVHYATFMAARAYLAARESKADQQRAAQQVVDRMLFKGGAERFRGILEPDEGAESDVLIGGPRAGPGLAAPGSPEARDRNWEQGVSYRFKTRLYMMPVLKSGTASRGNFVRLESQSWLGREPTEEECGKYMKTYEVDNGC